MKQYFKMGTESNIAYINDELKRLMKDVRAANYKLYPQHDTVAGIKDYGVRKSLCTAIAKEIYQDIFKFRKHYFAILNDGIEFVRSQTGQYQSVDHDLADDYTVDFIALPFEHVLLEKNDMLLEDNKDYSNAIDKAFKDLDIQVPLPPSSYTVKEIFTYKEMQGYQEINDFISQFSDADLLEFWEMCLLNANKENPFYIKIVKDPISLLNTKHIQYITLLYIFSTKYLDYTPHLSNLSDLDKENFKDQMAVLATLASGLILLLKEILKSAEEKDILIFKVQDNRIFILESTYKSFIREGGKPTDIKEYVAAKKISNTTLPISKDVILSTVDAFRAKYLEINAIRDTSKIRKRNEQMKNIYISLYQFFIHKMKEHKLEDDIKSTEIIGYNSTISYVRKLTDAVLFDVDTVTAHIFINIVIKASSFETYYGYIKELNKLNPNLESSQLAGLAGVQLIVDFVFSGLNLKRHYSGSI